jgi:hypothetical protein
MPPGSESVAESFYVGVLGLTRVEKPPALATRGGCWFRGEGLELHLGAEADFRPARKAHPALRVEGLDALAEDELPPGGPALAREGDEEPSPHG